jgi:hypothetical protein
MPLPRTGRAPDWPDQARSPEVGMVSDLEVTIPIVHELGSDLRGGLIERTRWLPPSNRPIVVRVESQVVTRAAEALHSPEYLATVRRRRCRALGLALERLAAHANREDFAVCTYPVLNQVNELLHLLQDASAEGNTREVLRQLRNTLMNGGWNKYRDPAVRRVGAEILNELAEVDEVLPVRVNEWFNRISGTGANPVGAPLFADDEEDEAKNGEAEAPG